MNSKSGKRLRQVLSVTTTVAALLMTAGMALSDQAETLTSPNYRKPILAPSSQIANQWKNVIPNALADYFTYRPYRTADAVKLGFPSSCGRLPDDPSSSEDCYTITVKKFQQALDLHGIFGGAQGLLGTNGTPFGPITWVQGYGSGGVNWAPPGAPAAVTVTGNAPAPFVDGTFSTTGVWHFPAPTIKGTKGRPVRVTWLNELPNEKQTGFDPTLCDNAPSDCYPYNRIATHVHGGNTKPDSDGYALAWFTPLFAQKGPGWVSTSQYGPEGTYRYPLEQQAATIWYHDHAFGLTHTNTNMGMAGFFPITDDNEKRLQGIGGTKYLPTGDYELGFALQDRVFYSDGQLAMTDAPIIAAADAASCTFTYQPDGTITPDVVANCSSTPLFMKDPADGHLVPYLKNGTNVPLLATSTTLEFFGNMPVVNGVVYGTYNVEPRVYRMRLIGGTDSRTWIPRLKVAGSTPAQYVPFYQIGTEQGFLNNPVKRENFVLMPGERVDLLVDFNGLAGKQIIMENLGPDFPYGTPTNTPPSTDDMSFPYAGTGAALPSSAAPIPFDRENHPDSVPEIMMFNVSLAKTATVPDVPTPSTSLNLRTTIVTADSVSVTPGTPVRKLSLIEIKDQFGRTMPTIDARGFNDVSTTERPRLGDSEVWEIINTTADSHPMHLHLVAFQLINREGLASTTDPNAFRPPFLFTRPDTTPGVLSPPEYVGDGNIVPPADNELAWKDTIICPPGMVTRVKAKFEVAGQYVWHCHILSHEEHDMMRPFYVVDPASTTAKIYLGADDSFTTTNNGATVYGGTGNDTVTIAAGTSGLSIDQNVGRIILPGTSGSYAFQQTGNKINVYNATASTLIATFPVQGGAAGSTLSFKDGSATAKLAGSVMTLGDAPVSPTVPTVLSPVVTAGAPTTANVTKARVYLGSDDNFTATTNGTSIYGGAHNDVVTISAGTSGVTLDQNINRVNFSGASSSYSFKQTGNRINVYDAGGTILLVTLPLQGDADGTVLSFNDGAASALLRGGVMTLGGATVNPATASSLAPVLK